MFNLKEIIEVPTGKIFIADTEHGAVEFLAIGDYGKEKNIKADFLGLTKDIDGVPDGGIMPLEEKLVITISTQYGCSMKCNFCDVPKVGPGKNVSAEHLVNQVVYALKNTNCRKTKRLNIHYARMGEPSFNSAVHESAMFFKHYIKTFGNGIGADVVHPVVSTMIPKNNKYLPDFLEKWCFIKNTVYEGDAGLQISLNSTNDKQRNKMFGRMSCNLEEISFICSHLPEPVGRKYCLNFAMHDKSIIEAPRLKMLFDPKYFMVKITPIHYTSAAVNNDIKISSGYDLYTPYKKTEEQLKKWGFDVLVFIPSKEEDESRITCGNAILSDKKRR